MLIIRKEVIVMMNYEDRNENIIDGEAKEINTEQSQTAKKAKTAGKKGMKYKVRNAAVYGVIFGLASGLVFTGVSKATGTGTKTSYVQMSTTKDALSTAYSGSTSDSESGTYTVQEIAEKCMSSVVSISCTSVESVQSFFGGSQQYESNSAGSGIVMARDDDNLYIATNNHVVADANEISVCFNDSEDQVYQAEVKGTDSTNDLAIVAVSLKDIPEDVLSQISIATLGDSDETSVGEQVVAIGNALGYGQSVTSGYISALDREVEIDNSTAKLIQTDAAINPGNSGGALFNMKGEVIGINSAKFSSEEVEGMGYAIPVSVAEPILEQLMTMQKVDTDEKGAIGIKGTDVSSDVSEMYDIPQGVYVDSVTKDGAAESAGLEKGDIITAFDGKEVSDMSTLKNLLEYYAAGDKVEITVQRRSDSGYKEKKFTIKLDKASENETSATTEDRNSDSDKNSGNNGNSGSNEDSRGGFNQGQAFGW